jgi:ESCRT-I complex subunit VPS28
LKPLILSLRKKEGEKERKPREEGEKESNEPMDFLDIPYSERHYVDDLSDLYAAIVAIEKLEKAFHRDMISNESYETILRRLLKKYRTIVAQLENSSSGAGSSHQLGKFSIDAFWADYGSKCSAARQRVRVGHPDEVREQEAAAAAALVTSHQQQQQQQREKEKQFDPKIVLECGQFFITLMDCLKLQQTAVDQLFPILVDLVNSLKKLPKAHELLPSVLGKLESWVTRLTGMHPSDELNDRDTRELAFDLERGYQTFYQLLSNNNNSNNAA